MTLFQNLGIIYYLLPFIGAIDNKYALLFSILIGRKNHQVKISGHTVNFKSSQFMVMMDFIAVLMYSTSYHISSDEKIHIKLDLKTEFVLPLKNLSLYSINFL